MTCLVKITTLIVNGKYVKQSKDNLDFLKFYLKKGLCFFTFVPFVINPSPSLVSRNPFFILSEVDLKKVFYSV